MTAKYEIGDNIRILDASKIAVAELTTDGVYVIVRKDGEGNFDIIDDDGDSVAICEYEHEYIEKVPESSAPQFEGYVNIRQVSNLDNGNLLITLECDETVNMALIKAERDIFAKKQERKAEIQTEIARLQCELEELQ